MEEYKEKEGNTSNISKYSTYKRKGGGIILCALKRE